MKTRVIGNATVIQGDAYEALSAVDVQSFGLLLTDPMYGMGANAKGKSVGRGSHEVGGAIIDNTDWLIDEDNKLFDPAPFLAFKKIVLWGGNHFAHLLPSSPKWLVWDKRDGVASDDNSDCELAWTNLPSKSIRTYRHLWKGVCRAGRENLSRDGAKLHPYQKPVGLGKFCIAQARLQPGEPVIDFFAGSGAFGVAALEMGHPVTLIEKEPHWFDLCCRRVSEAQVQATLFTSATGDNNVTPASA